MDGYLNELERTFYSHSLIVAIPALALSFSLLKLLANEMKFSVTFATLLVSALAVCATPVDVDSREVETRAIEARRFSKRGLAFNHVSAATPFANVASWGYDWSPLKDGKLPAGIEYVPMLWGTDANHLNGYSDAIKSYGSNIKCLLGFNEPDLSSQSNMSPAAAAAAWKKYIQPYAGKLKLISPAVTNGAAPLGLAWLDKFMSACSGCTIDAVAIHIYDSATNVDYFKSYITGAYNRYKKPIWVTEFAGSGTTAQQQQFIKTMTAWLDSQSFVHRYAYFADIEGSLVSGGSLTAIGKAYAS